MSFSSAQLLPLLILYLYLFISTKMNPFWSIKAISVSLILSLHIFIRTLTAGDQCQVQLPQYVPTQSECYDLRQKDLQTNQDTYQLKVSDIVPPFPMLDMSPVELFGILNTDPFMGSYAMPYLKSVKVNKVIYDGYINKTAGVPIFGLKDYEDIRKFFRAKPQELLGVSSIFSQYFFTYQMVHYSIIFPSLPDSDLPVPLSSLLSASP